MKQTVNVVPADSPDFKGTFYDHVTKEKIRKHLSDPEDVITEQDIMNIKTDESILKAEAGNDAPMADQEENKDEDGNNTSSIDNASINILDSY